MKIEVKKQSEAKVKLNVLTLIHGESESEHGESESEYADFDSW